MNAIDKPPHWARLNSRYLYESQWYHVRQDLVRLPGGKDITYTLIEHPGYAMIVPLLNDGRVVMERVYRYPLERVLLECPSGGLGGDSPVNAAHRELEEETGYLAAEMAPLGTFACSSGISDELCYVFLGTGLTRDGRLDLEETEDISLELIGLNQLVQRALRGEIEDSMTAMSLLRANAYLSTCQ